MLTLGQDTYARAGVRALKLRHKIFAGLLLTLSSLNSASWSTTHTVSVFEFEFFTDLHIFFSNQNIIGFSNENMVVFYHELDYFIYQISPKSSK